MSDTRPKSKKMLALIEGLECIRDFPKPGTSRRTDDGYPMELSYDEFAYNRLVDSYRDAARHFLAKAGYPAPSEPPAV